MSFKYELNTGLIVSVSIAIHIPLSTMKRLLFQTCVATLCLVVSTQLHAQDTVSVEPGLGTLETAISTHGGDVVYKLAAGAKYGLEGMVEVSDQTLGDGNELVLIGEKTKQMPPVIQVGMDGVGSAFPYLFQLYNNLTIKNIFLSAQDNSGAEGTGVFSLNSQVRLVIDNCTIDPAGLNTTFGGSESADLSKMYLTNSLIMNNGDMGGPDDSGLLGSMAWDTLWVENNTFVSSGQDFIGTAPHHIPNNQFIWINHNTFLWHDVWIKRSYTDQNFYFTNNLLHDVSIFAHLYDWGLGWPDYKQGNHMLSLVAIDTMEIDSAGTHESLPSERRFFWEYNLQYNSSQLHALPKHAVDSAYDPIYLIPMLWEEATPIEYTGGIEVVSPADSSREHRILRDDVNWPHMKYANNWYDIDPAYDDMMIYSLNDSMIQNVLGWYGFVIWRENIVFDGTPSYKYEVDKWAGTDPEEFPAIWPRFDGSYTNEELLTASIESLPLGDLNWFPEAKARWMAEKSQIEDHILALKEEKYELGPGVGNRNLNESSSFSIYPNPVRDLVHISSSARLQSVRLFDVAGKLHQEIRINTGTTAVLDLTGMNKGIYILQINTLEEKSHTAKIIKN